MKTYLIKEIFGPTLQGEGSNAGLAVKFLRFSGCNKWSGREQDKASAICWFCDTDFLKGERLSVAEIVKRLDALAGNTKNLVISGGEPALQLDKNLLESLIQQGYVLHLETNGSICLDELAHYFTHISMSPKQSREETKLSFCHDLKLLYPSPISQVTPETFSSFPAMRYYLQPVAGKHTQANTQTSIAYCLQHPAWRLSLQMHKIIGIP